MTKPWEASLDYCEHPEKGAEGIKLQFEEPKFKWP